jgi:hypothetical protein
MLFRDKWRNCCGSVVRHRRIKGIGLSDNYVMAEFSTPIHVTFCTRNKPANNDLRFVKRFVGRSVCTLVFMCISVSLIDSLC